MPVPPQVCAIWPEWGTCLHILAQNPLVMLSEAGPLVLSNTLETLQKFGAAAVCQGEPLRDDCELGEAYFGSLLRGMCGGPSTDPEHLDFELCDTGTDAHATMRAEVAEVVANLVIRLRVARRRQVCKDIAPAARLLAAVAKGTAPGTIANEISAHAPLLLGGQEGLPLIEELCLHGAFLKPSFVETLYASWSDAPHMLPLRCGALGACAAAQPWALCALTLDALREIEFCFDGRAEHAIAFGGCGHLELAAMAVCPEGSGALSGDRALPALAPLLTACRLEPVRVTTVLLEALWAAAHGAQAAGTPLRLRQLLVNCLGGDGGRQFAAAMLPEAMLPEAHWSLKSVRVRARGAEDRGGGVMDSATNSA